MEDLLTYSSICSPLFGVYLGFRFRLLQTKGLQFVFILMLLSLGSDLLMLLLARADVHNLPVAHVYGLLEGLLIMLFFQSVLRNRKVLLLCLAVAYTLFYLFDSFFLSGIFQFNAYSRSLEALMVIGLSIFYFYQVYDSESDLFIDKVPDFWVIVGMLVYFSGALFSFLLSTEILSQSQDRFYGSWILHNISNFIKNMIFTVAIWKARPH